MCCASSSALGKPLRPAPASRVWLVYGGALLVLVDAVRESCTASAGLIGPPSARRSEPRLEGALRVISGSKSRRPRDPRSRDAFQPHDAVGGWSRTPRCSFWEEMQERRDVAARLAKLLSSGSQLDAAAGYRFDRIACKVSASTTCPRLATSATLAECGPTPAFVFARVWALVDVAACSKGDAEDRQCAGPGDQDDGASFGRE